MILEERAEDNCLGCNWCGKPLRVPSDVLLEIEEFKRGDRKILARNYGSGYVSPSGEVYCDDFHYDSKLDF